MHKNDICMRNTQFSRALIFNLIVGVFLLPYCLPYYSSQSTTCSSACIAIVPSSYPIMLLSFLPSMTHARASQIYYHVNLDVPFLL
jgi:hypothetical protein